MAVVLIIAAGCGKEKPKELVAQAVPTVNNQMPAFVVTLTDNSQVFFKDLTGKVLLVFFNPDCDHCQREAQLMSENKEVFRKYKVYFVTPDQMPVIAKFATDYNLIEPNFYFGRADIPDVIKAVGPINSLPTFFVYDNQALVSRTEGELTIEKLISLLK